MAIAASMNEKEFIEMADLEEARDKIRWGRSRKNRTIDEHEQKITGLLESGQLGIFAHGYWGHPAMKMPPEVNLLATAHYLQALDFQRLANQVTGMLGGKTPKWNNKKSWRRSSFRAHGTTTIWIPRSPTIRRGLH